MQMCSVYGIFLSLFLNVGGHAQQGWRATALGVSYDSGIKESYQPAGKESDSHKGKQGWGPVESTRDPGFHKELGSAKQKTEPLT